MKKILFTLLTFLVFGIGAYAQQANPNAPEITFDKTTHDYGKIEKGSEGVCTFTFKNTGTEPLILTNVAPSCGCTSPEWTKEPVLKGKTGVIKVKYNTQSVSPFSKYISVQSNAKNGTIQLNIKGEVVEKATASAK